MTAADDRRRCQRPAHRIPGGPTVWQSTSHSARLGAAGTAGTAGPASLAAETVIGPVRVMPLLVDQERALIHSASAPGCAVVRLGLDQRPASAPQYGSWISGGATVLRRGRRISRHRRHWPWPTRRPIPRHRRTLVRRPHRITLSCRACVKDRIRACRRHQGTCPRPEALRSTRPSSGPCCRDAGLVRVRRRARTGSF